MKWAHKISGLSVSVQPELLTMHNTCMCMLTFLWFVVIAEGDQIISTILKFTCNAALQKCIQRCERHAVNCKSNQI